jgi:hypothetical protein
MAVKVGIENEMEWELESPSVQVPKPPIAGTIYGDLAYWLAISGMIIAIIGSVMYLVSGGYFNETLLLADLWRGDAVRTIWAECVGVAHVPHGAWYLGRLAQGDCLAMLGIVVACAAGVVGMWGAFFGLLRSKGGIYIIFALIVAVILTLSALGIVSI